MNLQILENLGLSEKSAKVYLAALSLGTASVQDIADKAEVKRPTAYLHIDELLKTGLIEKYPVGKKEFFKAADPEILEKRSENQLREIKKLLPDLQNLRQSITGRPQVSVLEGKRGIVETYKEMESAHNIRFWADLASVEGFFWEETRKLAEAINVNEIRTREIFTDSPAARKSEKSFAQIAGKTYSSRISTVGQIINDNAVFDDTVAMFRLHQQNFFVVLIKEPTIATTIKALFDMAWESATPFIGR